ncbi:DUF5412 domain-containing protein [Bacillus sp. ILBB4]|nr:DUF5412 domain-containing protein [Bacillus sp. ILBB4]
MKRFHFFFYSLNSPNNTYKVELYRANGGATTSYTLRGEVSNNKNKESKNIYWRYDMTKKKIQYRGKIIVQWMLRKTSMILEENSDK